MQLILANIDEFSARAMVRLYEIGVELAVIRAAGGNGQSEIDQINWYSQLLIEANDTTQTDELRLKLLTVLVDNARLNEVPTPIGVYNIYQPLMGEVFGSVPFANITGLPLDNVALAAEFDKVLYKSGGTMTGTLLISPATRIDSTAALNIGTSTATTITIGRTGQDVSMPGTIIDALWGGLNIPVAKGGLGGLVFDDGANGQVPVKSGTGYVWGTPISGNDYVRIDGSSVMTGGLRLNATLSIDTNSAGTLGIGTGMATVLTIGRIGQAVLFPGTINSGVWHGTVIERPYGGFGNAMEAIPAGDRIYGYDIIDESSQMWEIGSRLSYDSGTKILTVNPNLSLTTLTATGLINGGSLASGVAATTAGTLVLRNATNSFTQTIRGTNPGANITYDLPTTAPTAGQYLTAGLPASGVSTLSWATLSALTNPMTTLGDTIYGGASGVATRLAGNTTTARQFLTSVGSAGLATAPVWATLVAGDIPNISTSQVTGLDTALMNKLGTTLASGKIFVGNGSGAAAPVFMNQDGTLSNTGALTISNGAITMAKMANATAQGNFMVRWSAGSGVWQEGTFGAGLTLDAFGVLSASGGGGGTVTSVDMTVPSVFTITGNPITASGTLAVGLQTQSANTVWAGPVSGGASTPAFRALVATDIPNISSTNVTEGTNLYFTTARVLATALAGLSITGSTITASDTVIQAFGKLQNQINGVLGGAIYQGTWNASTNSPTLTSGTGTKGYYYVVDVAGSTNLDGVTDWKVGDWAIFNGTAWQKVDNTDAVSSVNGAIGAVTITTTGTANRISVTGGSGLTPTIDIAATYVGQTSITTLGTVTTGTWGSGAVIGGATMTLGSDATGDIYYRSAGGILTRLPVGSNGQVLTLASGLPSWAAGGAGSSALSAITAATTTNSINNATFAQTWGWDTLTTQTGLSLTANGLSTGTILALSSTSTVGNNGTLFSITRTGANGTATRTNNGALISVTTTGTTSTNNALTLTASGATTNNALTVTAGNVLLNNATASVPHIVLTPTTSAFTGTVDGALAYQNISGTRNLVMYRNAALDYVLFINNNGQLSDANGTRAIDANASGTLISNRYLIPFGKFNQYSTVTVSSTSETSLLTGTINGTLTFNASNNATNPELYAGAGWLIKGYGTFVTGGTITGSFRLRWKIGSTTYADTGAVNLTGLLSASRTYVLDIELSQDVRTDGASGTLFMCGTAKFIDTTTNLLTAEVTFGSGTSTAIDTTANQTFDLTVEMATTAQTTNLQAFKIYPTI